MQIIEVIITLETFSKMHLNKIVQAFAFRAIIPQQFAEASSNQLLRIIIIMSCFELQIPFRRHSIH